MSRKILNKHVYIAPSLESQSKMRVLHHLISLHFQWIRFYSLREAWKQRQALEELENSSRAFNALVSTTSTQYERWTSGKFSTKLTWKKSYTSPSFDCRGLVCHRKDNAQIQAISSCFHLKWLANRLFLWYLFISSLKSRWKSFMPSCANAKPSSWSFRFLREWVLRIRLL